MGTNFHGLKMMRIFNFGKKKVTLYGVYFAFNLWIALPMTNKNDITIKAIHDHLSKQTYNLCF